MVRKLQAQLLHEERVRTFLLALHLADALDRLALLVLVSREVDLLLRAVGRGLDGRGAVLHDALEAGLRLRVELVLIARLLEVELSVDFPYGTFALRVQVFSRWRGLRRRG